MFTDTLSSGSSSLQPTVKPIVLKNNLWTMFSGRLQSHRQVHKMTNAYKDIHYIISKMSSYYVIVQNDVDDVDGCLNICSKKFYETYDEVLKGYEECVQHWYQSAAEQYNRQSKMYAWMKYPPMIMQLNGAKPIVDASDVERKILKVCEAQKAFDDQEKERLAKQEAQTKTIEDAHSKLIRDIVMSGLPNTN
jgi:hypothetical protein